MSARRRSAATRRKLAAGCCGIFALVIFLSWGKTSNPESSTSPASVVPAVVQSTREIEGDVVPHELAHGDQLRQPLKAQPGGVVTADWESDDELLSTTIETERSASQPKVKSTATKPSAVYRTIPHTLVDSLAPSHTIHQQSTQKDDSLAFNPTVQAPVVSRRRVKKKPITVRRRKTNSKGAAPTATTSDKTAQIPVQFANVDTKVVPLVVSDVDGRQFDSPLNLPDGTYLETCAACTRQKNLDATVTLHCTCCLIDGKNCHWNSTLVLDENNCGSVENVGGLLKCHHGVPAGSYLDSCQECEGNNTYIECSCCNGPEGGCSPTPPLVVVPRCGKVINRKGHLQCADMVLPDGPYDKSCKNCRFNFDSRMLTCDCCNKIQAQIVKSANVVERKLTKEPACLPVLPFKVPEVGCNNVYNSQGQLKCQGILPAGQYLEQCTDCSVSEVQQNDPSMTEVEGIPEQYRDSNPQFKLTCGCCLHESPQHTGCRPSVSLQFQKQWCQTVKVKDGYLRCAVGSIFGGDRDEPPIPGSYSDSCILCNITTVKKNKFMECFCLDASNSYQPRSKVQISEGCDIIENVRGGLVCRPESHRYHQTYKFLPSRSAKEIGLKLGPLIDLLNAGETAAKQKVEGEDAWQAFLEETRNMPNDLYPTSKAHPSARGIVVLGGGSTYFVSAWVDILMIRGLNCTLPIELWIDDTPEERLPDSVKLEMQTKLGVEVRTLDMLPADMVGTVHSKKFALKPAAIVFSRFKEVLFLDADNIPLVDLQTLFELPEYTATGALFWPDFPAIMPAAEIWKELPVSPFAGPQAESGQMVIDKVRHWQPMMLALYFNIHADWYYPKISFGDKDTYQTAWYVLGHHFDMAHWPVSSVGYGSGCSFPDFSGQAPELFRGHTMMHRLPNGKPLFLHKNLRKWTSALQALPAGLPGISADTWKSRTWQTIAACTLNPGLSIKKWSDRTNSISSQLCNNLWFFERMSLANDLDVSLLMRYQCYPTVKSVKVQEVPFVKAVGFDVETMVLEKYREVLSHSGYSEFSSKTKSVPGYHHSFCKSCKLHREKECGSCATGESLWEYGCTCQSPLHTQVKEELKLFQRSAEFCKHGVIRYVNHTLLCERMSARISWSGHYEYL